MNVGLSPTELRVVSDIVVVSIATFSIVAAIEEHPIDIVIVEVVVGQVSQEPFILILSTIHTGWWLVHAYPDCLYCTKYL